MQLQPVLKALRKADQDYGMIRPKDHIAVALSGGKDSLLLLHALKIYQKFDHTDFKLSAIHVDVGFDENLNQDLIDYCKSLDIPLEIVQTSIFTILQEPRHTRNGRIQCSLCANLKKGAMFKKAKEMGVTAMAFGHHADDAMETLVMNMLYGSRMATFSPRMHLKNVDLDEIRPLIYMSEPEIKKAIRQNKIPSFKKVCPNDGYTKRQEVKELLESLYKQHPQARDNFLTALKNSPFLHSENQPD